MVIAKWLATNPRVLIMDEPTKGIDVGAKTAVYRLMGEMVARGLGIPVEDMVEKIKVAFDARQDAENFLIIARTDARQSEGLDGSLRRLEAYAKAGADILFPEALIGEEEMRAACSAFDKPVMANMADGGLTPILPAKVLQEIGYAFAIYPAMTSLVAAAAMEQGLRALKEAGAYGALPLFDFKTFCSMIGFEDVWAFERQWAGDKA